MLIISRTPVRISFFGGGTDYPDFYLRHGGKVLGTSIDKFIHTSVKTFKSAFFDHSIRVAYSKTELVKSVDEILHPSVRESLKFKGISGNLDIHIFSDLPAKTGLGSSSSFTVGFLNALEALSGKKISKQKLALEACHVEQRCIQEAVGSQDQFHAAFGGFNVIEFTSSHVQVRPVVISREKKECLQDHLLVFYTGISRLAGEIAKEQIEKTKKTLNDAHLYRMLELVDQAEEVLTSYAGEEMVKQFGLLLDEGWNLKKQLSSQVTNPLIENAYEAAMRAGAHGGKLCGAGNGGFLIFFVPQEKKEEVRRSLAPLNEVEIRFENEGSAIIYMRDG